MDIDHNAVRALLTGRRGPVVALVEDTARRVANEAKRRAPVDEGRLRASIQTVVQVEGNRVIGRVGSDLEYAAYVHFGTGLYGPKGHKIFPVSKQVMTWIPRTRGQGSKVRARGVLGRLLRRKEQTRVFAQWTRGMRGRPFLTDALEAVSPWPVEIGKL